MTIQARQMLVASKNGIKCPFPMVAEYITVHNTFNDASANNEVSYMLENNNEVSYHFAIDDKEVVQAIPVNRNAWHAGDGQGPGNRKSIGIEICYSKSGGQRYVDAENLAVKFIAQLLKERGWGVDRVKKHQDWSGKYCPHRILDEGRWGHFIARIQNELGGVIVTSPYIKPAFPVNGVPVEYQMIGESTHLHWKVLDLIGLQGHYSYNVYKDKGVTCFNIDGVNVDAPIVGGDSYIPWNKIPGLQVKEMAPGKFEFFREIPAPQPAAKKPPIMAMKLPQSPEPAKKDYSGHWAEKDIDRVIQLGLMKGSNDGKFYPDQPLTRAQFATVLGRLIDKGMI